VTARWVARVAGEDGMTYYLVEARPAELAGCSSRDVPRGVMLGVMLDAPPAPLELEWSADLCSAHFFNGLEEAVAVALMIDGLEDTACGVKEVDVDDLLLVGRRAGGLHP